MAQQSVETILVRQLAGYLSVPILILDPAATVIFYNEPAEQLLGVRFDERGRLTPEEVEHLLQFDGAPAARHSPAVPARAGLRPPRTTRRGSGRTAS